MQIDFKDIYNQYSKLHPTPENDGVHSQIKFILRQLANDECQFLPTIVMQALRDAAQPDVITEEQAMQQEQLIDKFAMAALTGLCARDGWEDSTYKGAAQIAYSQAQAMMEVRKGYVK